MQNQENHFFSHKIKNNFIKLRLQVNKGQRISWLRHRDTKVGEYFSPPQIRKKLFGWHATSIEAILNQNIYTPYPFILRANI